MTFRHQSHLNMVSEWGLIFFWAPFSLYLSKNLDLETSLETCNFFHCLMTNFHN
jgi:hypothetical protein